MSWSTSMTVEKKDGGDIAQQVLDALNAVDRTKIGNQHCEKERDEQIDAVIRTTTHILVESGLAKNAEEIYVSMSGHANKDHNSDNSWANETINLSIAVRRYHGE